MTSSQPETSQSKRSTKLRHPGVHKGNLIVFIVAKSMLRQSADARPHSVTDVKKKVILCNQKCDAHNRCYVEIVSPSASADDEMCGLWLYTLTSADQRRSGYQVQLLLEGKPVKMEVDTGSAVSIISETAYNKLFQHLPVKPTHFYLKTYSGEWLTLLGEFKVG